MKVVLAYDLGDEFVKDLRATFPKVDFRIAYSKEEQLREVPDAEVQFGEIDRDVFLAAKRLRWFQYIGIGFDHIVESIPELVKSDVVMTNCRKTHVISMADHAFAMILAFAHNVPQLSRTSGRMSAARRPSARMIWIACHSPVIEADTWETRTSSPRA